MLVLGLTVDCSRRNLPCHAGCGAAVAPVKPAAESKVSGAGDKMKLISTIMLLILFITLLFPSCTKYADTSYLESALCGTWNWDSSSGGFTGKQLITPETLGYTKQLRFSSEGEYQEYHGSTLVITSRYSVVMKNTIYGLHEVICFSDSTECLSDKVIMKVSEISLHLSDPHPDGFGHSYIRSRN